MAVIAEVSLDYTNKVASELEARYGIGRVGTIPLPCVVRTEAATEPATEAEVPAEVEPATKSRKKKAVEVIDPPSSDDCVA